MIALLLNVLGVIITHYGIYIIVVVFLWFVLAYSREIRSISNELKHINQQILKLLAGYNYIDSNKLIVERINEIIEHNKTPSLNLFKAQYRKFHRRLLLINDQNNVKQYYCSNDIEEYITPQKIFHISNIHENSTSILIGIGLVFTFICIVLGAQEIHFIKAGATIVEISHHWLKVLSIFGTKFFSAMGGITAALIYTMIYGYIRNKFERRIYEFCDLMHTKNVLPLKNQNQLLYEIKEAIANSIVKRKS